MAEAKPGVRATHAGENEKKDVGPCVWIVFKAHRLLYHSTLGLRVIKKKKRKPGVSATHAGENEKKDVGPCVALSVFGFWVWGLGFRV